MGHFKRKIRETPICGIYVIKNKINNKIYIGKSIDIERRWIQHKYHKSRIFLHNVIKKYGFENFEFKIIQEIIFTDRKKTEIVLCQLEEKWINEKKSYLKKYGYNIIKISKPNLTYKRNKDFGKKISEIKINMNHCGKKVFQFSLNGVFIKEWKSAAEVERQLKIKAENISQVILKKQKSAGGYIWRRTDEKISDDELKEINTINRNRKKVAQYTKNDEFIQQFNSIQEACNSINCNSVTRIVAVCKGRDNSYKGFKWKYV
jgi:group I intron endonuclease